MDNILNSKNWRSGINQRFTRSLTDIENGFLQEFALMTNPDFNSKIMAKMILDNRKIIVDFADKVRSAEIMSELVPSKFIPTRYLISADPEALRDIDLPEEFILKTNHGSGGLIHVSRGGNPYEKLPGKSAPLTWFRHQLTPENFEIDIAILNLERWLSQSYAQDPNFIREWCYSKIEPRFIVEKHYSDIGRFVRQINMFFIHGRARVFSCMDRTESFSGLGSNFTELKFWEEEERHARIFSKLGKEEWEILVEAGKEISKYTDLVRVDWILTSEGPIFSELTNYPAAGNVRFNSNSARSKDFMNAKLSEFLGELGPY
jgi:hypothetical protein